MYITPVVCHLDLVPYSRQLNGVHQSLPAGGAMYDDHRHVSIVGIVTLFVHVAAGDGCFPLYVVLLVLSFSPFACTTLGS